MRKELFNDLLISASEMVEIEKKSIKEQFAILRGKQAELLAALEELAIDRAAFLKEKEEFYENRNKPVDFAEELEKALNATPEESRNNLIRAGILDENGNLKEIPLRKL